MTKDELTEVLRSVIKSMGLTKEFDVNVVSKKARDRTYRQNNYYWVLEGKIADKLKTSKEELHIIMLTRYGTTKLDDMGRPYIISVRSDVDPTKFYQYLAPVGSGDVDGKEFTHYRVLKGSHEFDSEEFSNFIDGVIYEAKQLKIETLTPAEIQVMKNSWKNSLL